MKFLAVTALFFASALASPCRPSSPTTTSVYMPPVASTSVYPPPPAQTATSTTSGTAPTSPPSNNYKPCPSGLLALANPQCCSTDVLGVADLNCGTVSKTPTSASDFQKICAAKGQQARCCLLPILGQGLVCTNPVGIA